jgi:hypothetical protein
MDSPREGVYLLHTREMCTQNKPIFKLGRSYHLEKRVKQYPNGSKILLTLECKNSKACEAALIKIFKTKFIQLKYYGTEYFEGNCYSMINEICNYINNIEENTETTEDVEDIENDEDIEYVEDIEDIENYEDIENTENTENTETTETTETTKTTKDAEYVIKDNVIINNNRTCPNCFYKFTFPSRLKLHFETVIHCKKTEEEINLFFSTVKKPHNFQCNKCNYTFIQKSSYTRHLTHSKCSKTQNIKKSNISLLSK